MNKILCSDFSPTLLGYVFWRINGSFESSLWCTVIRLCNMVSKKQFILLS